MRGVLSYRPGRSPLHRAGAPAAIAYLGSLGLLALAYPNPLLLVATGVATLAAGRLAGAGSAMRAGAGLAVWVAGLSVLVNPLVNQRGLTLLVRGPEAPLFGRIDITLEAVAEGALLGGRIFVVILIFCVWSACVDPDRVLRLLRPLAHRSVLTATLVARMVPVAAGDATRLREAASLRGPGAAPVGRATFMRRLVEGSLDRAIDVAATLELRGYRASAGRPAATPRRRSRDDRWVLAAGLAIAAAAVAGRLAGIGEFASYPRLRLEAGPDVALLCAAVIALALVPFATARHRG